MDTGLPLPIDLRELFCYAKQVLFEKFLWPHRLMVRTSDFHSGNRGSIPLGAKRKSPTLGRGFSFISGGGNRTREGRWETGVSRGGIIQTEGFERGAK